MKSHKINDIESRENNIQMEDFKLDNSSTKPLEDSVISDPTSDAIDKDSEDKLYVESDFEMLPEKENWFSMKLSTLNNISSRLITNHKTLLKWVIGLTLLAFYTALFLWSMICKTKSDTLWKLEDNVRFLWLSLCLFAVVIYKVVMIILTKMNVEIQCSQWNTEKCQKTKQIIFYVCCGIICFGIGIYIIYTAIVNEPYNLVSLLGIILLLLISYVFSTAPHMVNWKPVLLGIILQFVFAFLILTTSAGFETFKFLGDRVTEFLQHTEAGCIMVFGKDFAHHYFAFRILPIIVFLSSIMSVLYYLGVIQLLVVGLGTAMQKFMGTTCGESLNAAANIFLGMTESPLLIKPLLGRMTNSELHAIMTGGFATIAGSVLGAYIGYGAPANHLISASVMSAPAALAVSKLMCPETKKSKNTKKDLKYLPKSPYKNIVEATTAGASDSIPLVANIAVNLIAFVAILAFFNATLKWIGERICMSRILSFELICSYIFWPLALSMGVYIQDCRKIAELMGIKTFLNEFIAYERLGILINNRKIYDSLNKTLEKTIVQNDDIFIYYQNGTNTTLTGGVLMQNRSVVIATYALCGFANFGSMGILLSSLSTMIPHRRPDLSKLIVRAMIAGNIACFLTACIAGLFYKE
uniref:Slc28a-1 n=1 Tax=Schmidtea mediterranea TaxID=79327 RepID=A0A0H3YJA0_SCHMD|nr:slc28a-1 [Schmidtea mediterranea]